MKWWPWRRRYVMAGPLSVSEAALLEAVESTVWSWLSPAVKDPVLDGLTAAIVQRVREVAQ